MVDPLSEVIALLRPEAVFTKGISGAGRWAVRYGDFGHPSFCTVVEGRCRLVLADQEPRILAAGDFVLLPRTPGFTISGLEPALPAFIDPRVTPTPEGDVRHGAPDGPADVRLLGGYFVFASDNADLVVSLLPALIHIRGAARLSLQGHAEWQRTLAQHGAIEASFTGIDARAPLALDMLGSEVSVLGLGLAAQWRTSRLTLDLDARHGQSRTDLGLTANWSLRF